ncbi:DegT/DnrJ/EryC1/StrS family aminotransferase, partial [Salmonella enterica subsp. enterica serovar Kentucky]|nr:DegT/DnrJ/EryC1/StrS family aminotransferase [Salmonella enterica subsp. enterica serovar Kentucky]
MNSLPQRSTDFELTTSQDGFALSWHQRLILRHSAEIEKKLGEFIGVPHVLTTTSGSSANLLALTALTSPKLGERALKP